MCAENLGRALGQTLAETLELMNAVRSQCVAQQLQLNNTHTSTHLNLTEEENHGEKAGMTHLVQQMNIASYVILQK